MFKSVFQQQLFNWQTTTRIGIFDCINSISPFYNSIYFQVIFFNFYFFGFGIILFYQEIIQKIIHNNRICSRYKSIYNFIFSSSFILITNFPFYLSILIYRDIIFSVLFFQTSQDTSLIFFIIIKFICNFISINFWFSLRNHIQIFTIKFSNAHIRIISLTRKQNPQKCRHCITSTSKNFFRCFFYTCLFSLFQNFISYFIYHFFDK